MAWITKRMAQAVFALVLLAGAMPALAADGDLDAGFGNGGIVDLVPDGTATLAIVPRDVMVLPDGKLLFGGGIHRPIPEHPPYESKIAAMLLRLNADGSPDTGFGTSEILGLVELPDLAPGTRIQNIEAMTRLDDGSLVIVGTGLAESPTMGYVAKLHDDGSLDTSFGSNGVILFADFNLHAVAVDHAGRIVAAGEHALDFLYTSSVVRLTANGTPDATFGDNGTVSIPWSDPALNGYLSDIAITADDGVVAGGRFASHGPGLDSDFAIARIDATGAFDPAFGDAGWRVFSDPADSSATSSIDRLALLADGRIAFAGHHGVGDGARGIVFGRLMADGASDPEFGDATHPGFLDIDVIADARSMLVTGLVVQADGKLAASASYFSTSEKQDVLAVRATADGEVDTSFADAGVFRMDLAPDGLYSDLRGIAEQPDGRIVLAGYAARTQESTLFDFMALRLENTVATPDRIFASGFDG
jgi:uncharacterized delta-60 repeat protein